MKYITPVLKILEVKENDDSFTITVTIKKSTPNLSNRSHQLRTARAHIESFISVAKQINENKLPLNNEIYKNRLNCAVDALHNTVLDHEAIQNLYDSVYTFYPRDGKKS